jgi:hypothetical protein
MKKKLQIKDTQIDWFTASVKLGIVSPGKALLFFKTSK